MSWIDHVPAGQRRRRLLAIRLSRLLTMLRTRKFLLIICVSSYFIWCLFLLANGRLLEFWLALISFVCIPLLAYIIYWLMWKEFHE
jgi:fucose permease